MKRFLLLFFSTLMLAPAAQAATTGDVLVTGSVPIACDLEVTRETGAIDIPDISAGDTDRHIGTVTETCNSPNGYTVSLVTANFVSDPQGKFVDTVSTHWHPFDIKYDGVLVDASGIVTDSSTVAVGLQKPVEITYTPNPDLAGTVTPTYQETLTFTISAK